MANRWKGNFIVATEATSSGTAYTGKANGSWSLNNQIQQKQANLWAKGIGAPTAPTIGTATAGNANASVAFTASSEAGAPGSLTYTATSTPGSFTNTGSSSPIVVSGLTNGTQYTFKVKATNSLGYVSPDSAASNSTGTTVPGAPTIGIASAGNTTASVTFTPSADTGNLPITSYTATSNPDSITGTATSSPITVVGLTNYTAYTFTVIATNAVGNSLPSAASSSITPTGELIAYASGQTPGIVIYSWFNGFGSRSTSPASPVAGSNAITLSADNSKVAVSGDPDFINVYNISGASIGTKYAAPSVPPSGGASGNSKILFSSSKIAYAVTFSPYINAYSWNSNTGFGSKYADPTTLPTGNANFGGCDINSNIFAIGHNTSPYISVYPITTSFGTKYANPATLPTANGQSVAFSRDTSAILLGQTSTPFINAYAWSNGFGVRYSNPSTLPSGTVNGGITFNSTGTAVSFGTPSTPFVNVYQWGTGVGIGSRYANPAVLPVYTVYSSSFSKNDSVLVTGGAGTPFINAYAWSNGFGSRYSNPTTLPSTTIYDIQFSN